MCQNVGGFKLVKEVKGELSFKRGINPQFRIKMLLECDACFYKRNADQLHCECECESESKLEYNTILFMPLDAEPTLGYLAADER